LRKNYLVSKDETLKEWNEIKLLLMNNYLSYQNMWSVFWDNYNNGDFPNIYKLYVLSKIMPVSNAMCERGFSIQNSIKTKY
jgi:hypothetical protein